MIRKLRWKVTGVSMLLAAAILLTIFAGAFFTARSTLRRGSEQAMEQALEVGLFDALRPGQDGFAPPCFVAEVYPSGTVRISGSQYYQLDDGEALRNIIQDCLSRSEDSGLLSKYHLRYLRQPNPISLRIAFTDSSLEQSALRSLAGTSLLLALAALSVLFLCSYFLSALVTRPVERSWQAQQRFLSDASHELKTPLTVILSSAELLHTSEEENRGYVDNILSESRRMRALVENMLTLSRLENPHQQQPPLTPVDFSDLVTEAALRFEPVAYEAGQQLIYDVAENLTLPGRREQLAQLCGILLDNAIKYAPPHSTIRLTLRRWDRSACLEVENPGEPISPEKLPHLFDRFYRADDSRSDHSGFGLGLAIARTIAHEHGGDIRCRSDQRSTCFTVTLPLKRRNIGKEKFL